MNSQDLHSYGPTPEWMSFFVFVMPFGAGLGWELSDMAPQRGQLYGVPGHL
jgi:hypothetical protein